MAWDEAQKRAYIGRLRTSANPEEALKQALVTPQRWQDLNAAAQQQRKTLWDVLDGMPAARLEKIFVGGTIRGGDSIQFTGQQPQAPQPYVPGGTMNLPANPYAQAPPPAHPPQYTAPLPPQTPAFSERYQPTGKVLGKGGMGLVELVQDAVFGREVAKKTMLPMPAQTQSQLDEVMRARAEFQNEAQNQGRLQHPNILPAYDYGTDSQGRQYIIMKPVEGGVDLHKLIHLIRTDAPTAKEQPEKTRLELVLKMCDAIEYLHGLNKVHCDLKPGNVMKGQHPGELYVMDLGLIEDLKAPKRPDADRVLARSQEGVPLTIDMSHGGKVIKGTFDYMAPEQADGTITKAADAYAIGAILYEMLTPYKFRTIKTNASTTLENLIAAVFTGKGIMVDGFKNTNVAPELQSIIKAATHKDHKKRLTAQQIASNIRSYMNGEHVPAHNYTIWQNAKRIISKYPARVAAALGTLAVAGTVATGGFLYADQKAATSRARQEQAEAEAAAVKTRADADRVATQLRADAETERQNRQYEFHITQAREAANAGRLDEAGRHMRTARALRADDERPEIVSLENFINGDRMVTIAPINSNGVYWQISEMTRNGEVPVANSRSTGPVNVTLKHGRFYNLEAAPEGKMDYRHLFRMDNQRQIRLRAEPRINGQFTVDGRARQIPEFYLIANDSRDFYFSAVPTSIGQYVLFLKDRGIDVTDRTNELRPRFISNNQALPLTQMNVRQAQAYCDWLTEKLAANGFERYRARLPTPAEVELAAAPHSGWTYPWGYDVNPTNNEGTITNVYDATILQRALEGGGVEGLLRPLTISDNLLGVAASRAKHWGNIRRLAVENGRVYAVGASFMENDETLQQFRRDNQGSWLYRRQMTENQPDAATGFSVVVERTR